MKILLLHIPQIREDKKEIMVMPMGVFSIADYLFQNGYNVEIIHQGIEKIINPDFDIIRYIERSKFDVICFDLHWAKQTRYVLQQLREIKKRLPSLYTIVGGITATFFANDILKQIREVDFIIRGEGEYPLLRLLEEIKSGKHRYDSIPNLTYRFNESIYSNNISFFTNDKFYEKISHSNFSLLRNYSKYLSEFLYADFDTSKELGIRDSYKNTFYYNPGKGCPYNCIYCGSYFYKKECIRKKKGYFFFDINKAVSDIKGAVKYGIDTIRISFDPDRSRDYYIDLFDRIKIYNLRLIYDCFSLPSVEFIKSVSRSFREDSVLIISVETGEENVRKKIGRPIFSNRELMECLAIMNRHRVRAHIFISFGLPYEQKKNFKNASSLISEVAGLNSIGITVCPMILDIGSQMHIDPERFGVIPHIGSFQDLLKINLSDNRTYYSTRYLREKEILEYISKLRDIYE
jgi:radical SAM superfamily enzyme YgiQ (UPF0313 family)